MGREQRRLLIDPGRLQQAPAGLVGLTAAESRYLVKVLRYGPGAVFAIGDGAGGLWEAELIEPLGAQLRQPLEAPLAWQPPPTPPLVLLAALVKRDYEVLLRMAVELGADWLLPCRAEFDATTRQSGAVPLLEVLEGWTAREPPASLWLACGPEGGWSGAEETLARDQGWIAVDLGPRILRSSTAAVAGLGLLSDWRYRRWGC